MFNRYLRHSLLCFQLSWVNCSCHVVRLSPSNTKQESTKILKNRPDYLINLTYDWCERGLQLFTSILQIQLYLEPRSFDWFLVRVETFSGPNQNRMERDFLSWKVFHCFSASEEAARVESAMRRIESKSCVHFVRYNGHRDFIKIMKEPGKGCFAMIGYRKNYQGPHPVNYQSPACLEYRGTIEHELLHVLGLLHEQARPDRDSYVDILWNNIDQGNSWHNSWCWWKKGKFRLWPPNFSCHSHRRGAALRSVRT